MTITYWPSNLLIPSTRAIVNTITSTLAYQAIANRQHPHARYVKSPCEKKAEYARRAVNAFTYHACTLPSVSPSLYMSGIFIVAFDTAV